MKDLKKYDKIACSIHLNNIFFNVGDYLSALSLSKLYDIDSIVWLSSGNMDFTGNFIYGGGGMIRPNFSKREVYSHYKNITGKHSIIGVGINKDIKSLYEYSDEDNNALFDWIINAEYVSVRDYETSLFIKKIILNGKIKKEIHINPCPSYITLKNKRISKEIKYKIGFVPSFGHTKSYLPFIGDIHDFINKLILQYGEDNVVLLCHDINDFDYSKKNFPQIESNYIKEFDDVLNNYSVCNTIITARAHGIIFGASLGKKVSYIFLSDKLNSLYNYHYGVQNNIKTPIFNLKYHIDFLEKSSYPLNI